MKVFDANITYHVSGYLNENLKHISAFEKANKKLYEAFQIKEFFENNEELEILKEVLSHNGNVVEEPDRAEYGDFQTNANLANNVTLHLASRSISPDLVIEPTCGKGNFIIASLANFKNIKKVLGVEIFKPYVWETKFNIINFFS